MILVWFIFIWSQCIGIRTHWDKIFMISMLWDRFFQWSARSALGSFLSMVCERISVMDQNESIRTRWDFFFGTHRKTMDLFIHQLYIKSANWSVSYTLKPSHTKVIQLYKCTGDSIRTRWDYFFGQWPNMRLVRNIYIRRELTPELTGATL
jgi:hypothetical protein